MSQASAAVGAPTCPITTDALTGEALDASDSAVSGAASAKRLRRRPRLARTPLLANPWRISLLPLLLVGSLHPTRVLVVASLSKLSALAYRYRLIRGNTPSLSVEEPASADGGERSDRVLQPLPFA